MMMKDDNLDGLWFALSSVYIQSYTNVSCSRIRFILKIQLKKICLGLRRWHNGKECLLFNQEDLSSNPQQPHKSCSWPCIPITPSLRGGDRWILGARLSGLVGMLSIRFTSKQKVEDSGRGHLTSSSGFHVHMYRYTHVWG